MVKVVMEVQSKAGLYTFAALIHAPTEVVRFYLHPRHFYLKWGNEIPEMPHHELEIVEPKAEFFEQHKLHVHRSERNGNWFVCYPRRVATVSEAVRIFQTWCLGSVVTIVEQVDLNTLYSEVGSDPRVLERLVEERYGIHQMSCTEFILPPLKRYQVEVVVDRNFYHDTELHEFEAFDEEGARAYMQEWEGGWLSATKRGMRFRPDTLRQIVESQ